MLLNDTLREKLLSPISTRMAFFMCLHSQISSIHFIKEYRRLKNVINQLDIKNEWFILSASFTAKFGLVFVLALENAFFLEVSF